MRCTWVRLPNGATAIVKHAAPRKRKCSACGTPASAVRECDWIMERGADGKATKTCDAALCVRCSTVPQPEKDLCPEHAAKWARMRQAAACSTDHKTCQ